MQIFGELTARCPTLPNLSISTAIEEENSCWRTADLRK
jgi:hypothetical protein